MLARLLGFMLGNRGGLAPKIDSTEVRNACLLLKGPKCCVLEGSPRYRGGIVMQFAQVRLVQINNRITQQKTIYLPYVVAAISQLLLVCYLPLN